MPLLEKTAVDSQAEADVRQRALIKELFEEIRAEAYFLWQKRGSPDGDDLSDWYTAQEKVLEEAHGA